MPGFLSVDGKICANDWRAKGSLNALYYYTPGTRVRALPHSDRKKKKKKKKREEDEEEEEEFHEDEDSGPWNHPKLS